MKLRNLLFSALASLMPALAQAGTINIILSDMDITYRAADAALYDVDIDGNNQLPSEADPLASAALEVNGSLVNSLMGTMYGDLLVSGMPASIPLGALSAPIGNAGGGFGFTWWTASGDRLRIGLTSIQVLPLDIPVSGFPDTVLMVATGTILEQVLPSFGGMLFDPAQTVQLSYASSDAGLVINGANTTGFMASGALTITGVMVIPEPSSLSLIGLIGLAAAGIGSRRLIG